MRSKKEMEKFGSEGKEKRWGSNVGCGVEGWFAYLFLSRERFGHVRILI